MQLDDRTFRLFRHDVHHAYLLLHQAFLQLPPIQLLTLEPMPLPCHEDLNQPPPLEPYTASTPPLQSEIEVPSDHEEEDNKIFMLATDQQLPHLAPQAKFPSPVRHVPAPDATELPMPSTIPSKSPLRSPPDTTRRHRRTTKPRKDKEPAKRRPSRSRSPMMSPRPWTEDDLNCLKDLKGNTTAKHSWKVIASKLGRSEPDVKSKRNEIKKVT